MKIAKVAIPIFCAIVLASCSNKKAPQIVLPSSEQGIVDTAPTIQAKPQTQAFPMTGMPLVEGMSQAPRPVAVMVDNSREAYPQWGIGSAQVIVEAITEGGTTRLMCLYNQATDVPKTGPIRSVRDMFLQVAMPLNAVPVHIGASVFGYNLLNYYHWQTVDGMSLGVNVFDFDRERALVRDGAGKKIGREHCWYTHGAAVQNGMGMKNISPEGEMFPLANFSQTAVPNQADANQVLVNYSFESQAGFTYSAELGKYLKTSHDGLPHVDANDNSQLAFDNVLLLRCNSFIKPDGVHTEFDLSGGEGWWISGGKLQAIRWEKPATEEPIKFFDSQGNPITIKTGKTYLGFLNGTAGENLLVDTVPMLQSATGENAVSTPT